MMDAAVLRGWIVVLVPELGARHSERYHEASYRLKGLLLVCRG